MPSPTKNEQRIILETITYSDGIGGTITIRNNCLVFIFQSSALQKNYRKDSKRYYSAKEIKDILLEEFQHIPMFNISTGTIKKFFEKGDYFVLHKQKKLEFRPGAVWVNAACFKPLAKNIFDAVEAMRKDLQ